jgi:CO/xanthine dehydrogenase FAD-binding subunit
MIPASFDYVRASSLAETVGLLQKHPDGSKLVAGGHTLMTLGTKDQRGKDHTHFYLPTDIAFAPNGEL